MLLLSIQIMHESKILWQHGLENFSNCITFKKQYKQVFEQGENARARANIFKAKFYTTQHVKVKYLVFLVDKSFLNANNSTVINKQ